MPRYIVYRAGLGTPVRTEIAVLALKFNLICSSWSQYIATPFVACGNVGSLYELYASSMGFVDFNRH